MSVFRPLRKLADPAIRRAVRDGRSYWQVRYHDGTIVNEFDGASLAAPDLGGIERRGLVQARLICPNGMVGVLGNDPDHEGKRDEDISDRLFEFKQAWQDIALPIPRDLTMEERARIAVRKAFASKSGQPGRRVGAQIIGLVHGRAGDGDDVPCTYWAWEYPGRLAGPLLNKFPHFAYGGEVWVIHQQHVGVKAD